MKNLILCGLPTKKPAKAGFPQSKSSTHKVKDAEIDCNQRNANYKSDLFK